MSQHRIDQMRQRCAPLLAPTFAASAVAPLIGETGAGDCSIVREHGSRLTLRYRFPSGAVVFAKAYSSHSGRNLYGTLRALWQAGFNDAGALRVPEPLGFLEDGNVVLMRGAGGARLSSRELVECPLETATARVRAAARWLAKLHSARLSSLGQERHCERLKILEESDLLVEAAATRPEHVAALLEFLGDVKQLARTSLAEPPLTPTHGQFIPSTLFVGSEAVTAIDLDTVAVSDPAKDVASFVSRVKYRRLFQGCGEPERAACLAREFLDEYARSAGHNLANLPYYLGLYCLREFAKFLASADADRDARERAERLCRTELRDCLRQGALEESHPGTKALLRTKSICLTARSGLRVHARAYPYLPGLQCAKVASALWAAGFDHQSPYRVPEVAAFLPDRTVLLMHGAEGAPLSAAFERGNGAEAVRGSREAGRWLAALHRCSVRVGTPERDWVSLKVFRVSAGMVEVCARFPDLASPLLEILNQLKDRVEGLASPAPAAQTHGRFRPKHVSLGAGATTAIDLDRSRPADPAKDVAEFVADLRSAAYDGRYDRQVSERAAEAFLEEYFSRAPNLEERVACYSACCLTRRLLKSLIAGGSDSRRPERFERYREAIAKLCQKA